MKTKSMKPLTFRKSVNRAKRYVALLRVTHPTSPNWEGIRTKALYWKGLSMDLATTNDEISEASQI